MAGTPPPPGSSSGSSSGRRRSGSRRPSQGQGGGSGGGRGASGGSGGGRSSGTGRQGSGSASGGGRGSSGGSGRGSSGGGGRRRGGSGRGPGGTGAQQPRSGGGGGRSAAPNRNGNRSGARPGGTTPARDAVQHDVAAARRDTEILAMPVAPGVRDDGAEFRHNRRRAVLIAAVPGIVVLVVVGAVCIAAGLPVVSLAAGVAAGLVVWLTVWRGATGLLLRAIGARPGNDEELARAENLVDGLCATMGVEPPEILVIDEWARQAVALGRKSGAAVIIVTSGLLESLDPVCLEGVLAHELVHVKRADIAPATMAAAVLLPLAGFVPVSGLVHTLAGRGREFRTDRLAVAVTRFPPGLHEALLLMAEGPAPRVPSALTRRGLSRATRWLWTVALPESPGGDVMRWDVVDELDAPALRVSTLAEW